MTSRAPTSSRRGVTLLELLVVVTILGIMLSVTAPLFRGAYTSLEVRNAYKDVMAMFRHAQERAIMEEREFRVNLDQQAGAYWLSYRKDPMEFPGKFVDVKRGPGEVKWLPETVQILFIQGSKYDKDTRAEYISFYPNGAADRATVRFRAANRGSFLLETGREAGIVNIKER